MAQKPVKTQQSNWTPWNPSPRAIARVPEPRLPPPEMCRYCGKEVEIVNERQIYGKEYGKWPWMYHCAECDARVGMHPDTNIPLGTLADKETRNARKLGKMPFVKVWKSEQIMTQSEAYSQLAAHMDIPASECHFGLFSVEQCRSAWRWATAILKSNS